MNRDGNNEPAVARLRPPAWLSRVYFLALVAFYPRRDRRRFSEQMLAMVEDGWREQCFSGRTSTFRFGARVCRDLVVSGLVMRLARRRAATVVGDAEHSPQLYRTSSAPRTEVVMGNLYQDLKFALRMTRSSPGFSIAVVLTLALGIGANAAIFSVVNAVVLSPLPYPEAERLVHIWTRFPQQDIDRFEVSQAEFIEYKAESELFEGMFAYTVQPLVLTGYDRPQGVTTAWASADVWDVLGGEAQVGRTFTPEEDLPGNDLVVVLEHGFWQQTFAGDPSILGEMITLNGTALQVIGVMPEGFRMLDSNVDMWMPLAIDAPNLTRRDGHFLGVVGRTVPDADLSTVLAEMQVVSDRWGEQFQHGHPITAVGLHDQVVGSARESLFVLAAAVVFVLLIACANVAGLLMARTTSRQQEIAVRAALGAQRSRLVRQILTEGVLLSCGGGLLGLAIAGWGTQFLLRLEPGNLPRVQEIGTDASLLAFVLLTSLIAGLSFAAVPAWRTANGDTGAALKPAGRTTAGTSRQRFQRLMVVTEVAVAIVLVVGAGLLVRSFAELTRVDPGLDPDRLLSSSVTLPGASYPSSVETMAFWERVRGELASVPGFSSTTLVRALPLRDETFMERFLRDGDVENPPAGTHVPGFQFQVSFPGYFRAIGIPLVAGRDFAEADRTGTPRVAIVSESLVRRYFPDQSPVGQSIRILASTPNDVPFEIVGVAGDVQHEGLETEVPIQIYVPYAQAAEYRPGLTRTAAIVVRTDLDTEAAARQIRQVVWAIDPDLAVADVSSMSSLLSESVARPRFVTLLLSLFSALALGLASIGVYGIVAYSVAQRTREMGVRIALGASSSNVLALVLRQGLMPAGIGIVLGIAGALVLSRAMSSLLFGITPYDPSTYVAVTAILGSTAFLAAWIPARRATKVDPLESLRSE